MTKKRTSLCGSAVLNIPLSSYCCCCCFPHFCCTLAPLLTNGSKLSWKGPFLRIFTRKVTSDHKTKSEIGHNTDLWSFLINYVTSGHEIVSDAEIAKNGIAVLTSIFWPNVTSLLNIHKNASWLSACVKITGLSCEIAPHPSGIKDYRCTIMRWYYLNNMSHRLSQH